jgi:hypothetical protein
VAIMKTIEEKEDLVETLKLCQQTLEELVSEEKSPINRIATQE